MKNPEKTVHIKLHDGKQMSGVLRGSVKRPVLLMVHGLTGHNQEHLFFNGARYFDRHGISTLRINLYSDGKDARCLSNCTLKTHAQDVSAALKYLKRHGAKQIFALGHSYGGPSIMLADQKMIDGYILLDSSYKPDFIKLFGAKNLNKKQMKIDWGVEFIVSRAMKKFSDDLDWAAMARKIKKPVLAVYAGKGILQKSTKIYSKTVSGPAKLVGIPGATHCFDEDGAEEKLFHEILN